jgi:hypothetical protein
MTFPSYWDYLMDYSGLMDFNGFFHIYILGIRIPTDELHDFSDWWNWNGFFVHSAKGM